ncbi:hypothetical protein CRG98_049111 [Punica granatum]|uniref:Uncharacterized protein n=1 Tax=Punica granatum TaxID=22663 RepID=A0A2I0HFN9_PUNGR|nr:hypothetical protein CRG98_049111 [Punica granatum]
MGMASVSLRGRREDCVERERGEGETKQRVEDEQPKPPSTGAKQREKRGPPCFDYGLGQPRT